MYIIIGGGGEVGYYLTRNLLNQGHEVLLLEKSSGRAGTLLASTRFSIAELYDRISAAQGLIGRNFGQGLLLVLSGGAGALEIAATTQLVDSKSIGNH